MKAPSFDSFVDLAKRGAITVLILGVFAYAAILVGFSFNWIPERLGSLISANQACSIGLPVCAITAFAIVGLLEQSSGAGKLSFKAFGMDFTGPAGPVTLWVVCYLTLVGSMRIVGFGDVKPSESEKAKVEKTSSTKEKKEG